MSPGAWHAGRQWWEGEFATDHDDPATLALSNAAKQLADLVRVFDSARAARRIPRSRLGKLATMASLDVDTVNRLWSGDGRWPYWQTVSKVAVALGVHLAATPVPYEPPEGDDVLGIAELDRAWAGLNTDGRRLYLLLMLDPPEVFKRK